jgi:signal transduction histidine kinase
VLELGCVVGLANHTVLMTGDGTLIPIEDSAAPIRNDAQQLIGVVLVFRNATKERKAQEILRKTEKLASAARIAASIAHEVNNPLAAATNLVYIAKHAPETHPVVAHYLAQAEQELARVAHITQQTLGFYRESVTPGPIELPRLIESVLTIHANKLKSKEITVETDFGQCPPVNGLAGELKQVISNLVSNAADAVEKNGNIVLRLRCKDGAEDGKVQVTVEDDGPGIAAEYADLIFEPFFTTKKDVGIGLGLWVTKEIVERHGGRITIGPGIARNGSVGASFSINMPLGADALNGSTKNTPVSMETDSFTNGVSAANPSNS